MADATEDPHCGDCLHFESRQGNLGECRKRRMAVFGDQTACPWDYEPREEDGRT